MAGPSPITKLEAVNALLASIGERPVNTLTETNRQDVNVAVQAIDNEHRIFLVRGWWFNTETATLSLNGSNQYPISSAVLKWKVHKDARNSTTRDYVRRGNFVYNRKTGANNGFTEATLKSTQVTTVDFEEMPDTAREYVYARAGIAFQAQAVGSQILSRFTEGQAIKAWNEVQAEEIEQEGWNLQNDPTLLQVTQNR